MAGENDRRSAYPQKPQNGALGERLEEAAYAAFVSRPPLARLARDLGTLQLPDHRANAAQWGRAPAPDLAAEWAQADKFARSRVRYTDDADLNDPLTREYYANAQHLLRELFIEKQRQAARGSVGSGRPERQAFDDLKRTSVSIGPSPWLLANYKDDKERYREFDPKSERFLGATTRPFNSGPEVFIDPGHPRVSPPSADWTATGALNYPVLHEYDHAFGRPFAPRISTDQIEAQVNLEARDLANDAGATYPSDEELERRGGVAPGWPLHRRRGDW